MKGEITLRDLSRIANLSINTISRALNDQDGVSESTRVYVKKLAAEHNYRPNMMARSMRGMQSSLIGTLVGDITDQFFVELLSGVEEEVAKEAMPIIIGNTGENLKKQKESLDLLLSYGCKNIIITPVHGDRAFIDELTEAHVAFVIADRTIECMPKLNQVSINNRQDLYRATEYLIQCGHKHIAIVNQRSSILTETDRVAGYEQAMAAHGLEHPDSYVLNGRDAAHAAKLCTALLSQPERPTALLIAKDTLALSVVSAIYELGLSIPNDLSVLIYGSPEWSQTLRPYFTCMERAVKDIGRTSARILIDRMRGAGGTSPINITFDSSLKIRDSVRII